jgi:hypothetical protein
VYQDQLVLGGSFFRENACRREPAASSRWDGTTWGTMPFDQFSRVPAGWVSAAAFRFSNSWSRVNHRNVRLPAAGIARFNGTTGRPFPWD